MPIAILALDPPQTSLSTEDRLGRILASPGVLGLLLVCAAGEVVVDKLPITPPRTEARGLAFRVALGTACGMFATRGKGKPTLGGAGMAGVSAILGSYGLLRARRAIVDHGVPDPLVGALEDAVILAASIVATRGLGAGVRNV